MLRIVACIKQVPDTTQVRIDPVTNTLIREGVPSIINPFDVHAIEEAMRLKERYGGTAIMLCMGPPWADEALRKALSWGVDEAVLLTDRALAGSDTLATSAALAAAIRKLGEEQPVDIAICGKQTIDGDTAQVGPGIAARLGYTQLTYVDRVESVDLDARRIRVRRMLEGAREIVEGPLPALLTVVKEINQPRYASLPDLVRGLRARIPVWHVKDIGLGEDEVGLKGSPTQVRRIFPPPRRGAGEMIAGALEDPHKAAADVIDKLIESGHIGNGSKPGA
jgi:electron transfer flavoprotein beta subunit